MPAVTVHPNHPGRQAAAPSLMDRLADRLGLAAGSTPAAALAAFDAQRAARVQAPATLAARAGWAAPANVAPRPAAPSESAIAALAAKAGWTTRGKA
ncbi:hypothetical protein [Microbacterium sp. SA39]|uniref:hypothetical protein n=1 Tax=Microbacterium sp. SA39 TaxID=1263625 RepID=UPI0005FA69F2|nr:hypothetical protein [Microbacterium sp. SA39]